MIIALYFKYCFKGSIKLAGLDERLFSRLDSNQADDLFYIVIMTLIMAIYTGCGVGYAATLTGTSIINACVFGFLGFLFCLNIARMLNSGGGYPLGADIENLDQWSPSFSSVIFLCCMGALITTPNVLLVFSLIYPDESRQLGIFDLWDALWNHKLLGALLMLITIMIFSSFSWLRFVFLKSIKEYERLKWHYSRNIVDKRHRETQEYLKSTIEKNHKTRITGKKHFADAPYNKKSMLFGVETAHIVAKDNQWLASAATKIEPLDKKYKKERENIHSYTSQSLINNNKIPDIFNKKIIDILFSENFKEHQHQIAKHIGINADLVLGRCLYSPINQTLRDTFSFELKNSYFFQKAVHQKSSHVPHQTISANASCPVCQKKMDNINSTLGIIKGCKNCGTTLISGSQIKQLFGAQALKDFWQNKTFTLYLGPTSPCCPQNTLYRNHYRLVSTAQSAGAANSDEANILHCEHCDLYCFSKDQLKPFLDIIRHETSEKNLADSNPGNWILYTFQLLSGIPREVYNPIRRIPKILIATIVMLIGTFIWQTISPDLFIQNFLFYPYNVNQQPWTMISSIFLHGGLLHLIGNILFLWIFADNIEDKYGWKIFLLLFIATGFSGNFLYYINNINSTIGCLGASGSVYGFMGAYIVFFRHVKIWWVILFIRFKVSIMLFALTRVVMDIYGLVYSDNNIAWLAHIGGFLSGCIIAYIIKHQLVKKLLFRLKGTLPSSSGKNIHELK